MSSFDYVAIGKVTKTTSTGNVLLAFKTKNYTAEVKYLTIGQDNYAAARDLSVYIQHALGTRLFDLITSRATDNELVKVSEILFGKIYIPAYSTLYVLVEGLAVNETVTFFINAVLSENVLLTITEENGFTTLSTTVEQIKAVIE